MARTKQGSERFKERDFRRETSADPDIDKDKGTDEDSSSDEEEEEGSPSVVDAAADTCG